MSKQACRQVKEEKLEPCLRNVGKFERIFFEVE